MTGASRPTIVEERAARRNVGFGLVLALLAYAVVSPMLRDGPLDTGTQIAVVALALVTLAGAALWWHLARHPTSLVVTDDEIRLIPDGRRPELRRIPRSAGSLRLAKEGSVRSKTLTLSSLDGEHRLPLNFMDRRDIVDACFEHGWDFGEALPDERTATTRR